jgi:hypothetical protein
MTDTEETGLLKRLEAFMSKGKNTTALSIEKDGGGYSVRSSLINPPKAKSLGEAIDNFLKNAESERS